jgi:glycolate oxidase FAD binding subunit
MTVMPDTLQNTLQNFTGRILEATKTGQPLRLRGGGTKDFLGQSLQGDVLDTTAYSGILSYEPSELVITVCCGTPLAEVEAAFALEARRAEDEVGAGASLPSTLGR